MIPAGASSLLYGVDNFLADFITVHSGTPCNSMHRHILANNQYVTIALSPLTTPIPQATNPHPAPEPCSGRITGILRPLLAAKQSAARMRAVVRRCSSQ